MNGYYAPLNLTNQFNNESNQVWQPNNPYYLTPRIHPTLQQLVPTALQRLPPTTFENRESQVTNNKAGN